MLLNWELIYVFIFCFPARKTKKKIKGIQQSNATAVRELPESSMNKTIVPAAVAQLTPTLISLLEAIEPEVLYSGYDSTLPETAWRLMSSLNMLGGRQVVSVVKWAKAIPGNFNSEKRSLILVVYFVKCYRTLHSGLPRMHCHS